MNCSLNFLTRGGVSLNFFKGGYMGEYHRAYEKKGFSLNSLKGGIEGSIKGLIQGILEFRL